MLNTEGVMNHEQAKVLINFLVPKATKNRFDAICRINGRSRTQVLIDLMNDHIVRTSPVLEARYEKLKSADNTLAAIEEYQAELRERIEEDEAEFPPSIFWSDEPDPEPYF